MNHSPPDARSWHDLDHTLRTWFGVAAPQAGRVPSAEQDLADAQLRLNLPLPAAHARWWRERGALPGVWNVQDTLRAPDALCVAGDAPGKLVIAHENQSVVRWAFALADVQRGVADPPVWVEDLDVPGRWRLEAHAFSDWLLQRLALNAKFADAPLWRGNGSWPHGAQLAQVQALCARLAPRLRWGLADSGDSGRSNASGDLGGLDNLDGLRAHGLPPASDALGWPPGARLWGDDSLVVESDGDTWLWLTARTEAAWRRATALLNASGLAPEWVVLAGPDQRR